MTASLLGRVGASVRRRTVARRAPLGTEAVPVGELISPLRLDILVRVDFFRLIDSHPEVDSIEMVDLARNTHYDTWFRQVAMARYQPDVATDDVRYATVFAERVGSATQLWRSFRSTGYDERHPIVLRQADGKTQLPDGKPVVRSHYMGDGCHRLAMMIAAGADCVPAGRYRVEPIPLPRVIDNTSVLLPLLQLSEAAYAAFLGLGYGVSGTTTVAGTLRALREGSSDLRDEAAAVAARDGYPSAEANELDGDSRP